MSRKATFVLLLMTLLALPLVTGCRTGKGIMTPQTSFDSPTMSLKQAEVSKLIMRGCVNAGWTPVDRGNNTIEAKIVVRGKHTVIVEIPYTVHDYQIVYKSSINMEHKVNSKGEMSIHSNYNNWVIRLDESINKSFANHTIL